MLTSRCLYSLQVVRTRDVCPSATAFLTHFLITPSSPFHFAASCVRNLWHVVKPSSSTHPDPQSTASPFMPSGTTFNGMKGNVIEEEEEHEEEEEEEKEKSPPVSAGDKASDDRPTSLETNTSKPPVDAGKEKEEEEQPEERQEEEEKGSRSASRPYFVCLVWAHVAVYFWSHSWIVQLLPIPVAIVLVKKLCKIFLHSL